MKNQLTGGFRTVDVFSLQRPVLAQIVYFNLTFWTKFELVAEKGILISALFILPFSAERGAYVYFDRT